MLRGLPPSADVMATLRALRELGLEAIGGAPGPVEVKGPASWNDAPAPIHCANSGTTARLLAGLLAGLGRSAELDGDESLRRRPMDRVVYPLQAMGARLRYVGSRGRLPILVEPRASGSLRSLRYRPRVSSAQVKSALLLAAVTSRTELEIRDRGEPRDHTERLLKHMGAPLSFSTGPEGQWMHFDPSGWDGKLRPLDTLVPGDVSSAAFLIAGAVLGGHSVRIRNVGLNPTRTGFLEILNAMGASVGSVATGEAAGEPVGDVEALPGTLGPFRFDGTVVPRLIDEIPILAVLAARAEGTSEIRGAGELRHKESDRLALLAANLGALGVECEELEDGLRIRGTRAVLRGGVRTGGDHRLAMAFGVLSRLPGCRVGIDAPECVAVSFPGFWEALDRVLPKES
jgi:3-phosphoshikimate 1-carboxyvinyltransferase